MRGWILILLTAGFSSCSQPEAEMEPDYDNMVLLDESEDEWLLDEEKDRKVLAQDRPDPQELILIEPSSVDHLDPLDLDCDIR